MRGSGRLLQAGHAATQLFRYWRGVSLVSHGTRLGRVCVCAMAAPTEVVNLVSDSDADPSPRPTLRSAAGAVAAAVCEVAASGDQVDDDDDAAARRRIMDFARTKRPRLADDRCCDDAPLPLAPGQAVAGSSSVIAGSGPGGGGSSGGSGLSNLDLRALHQERVARLQQQQPSPTSTRDSPKEDDGNNSGRAAMAGDHPQRRRSPGLRSGRRPARSDSPLGREQAGAIGSSGLESAPRPPPIALLTYNCWFNEDVAVLERMQGIGAIVESAGLPTFVCLQEVTPLIQDVLMALPWWQQYNASEPPPSAPYYTLLLTKRQPPGSAGADSISSSNGCSTARSPSPAGASTPGFARLPYANSRMGRGLDVAQCTVAGRRLLVATTHLESPMPPTNMFSEQRTAQLAGALEQLHARPAANVLLAGDMNWTDSRDGSPPLPAGWVDAWEQMHPGKKGYTYDTSTNAMMSARPLRLRLDRIFARLADWRLSTIEIVGTQPLPGLSHTYRGKQLPVLCSDHYGLLLRLEPV